MKRCPQCSRVETDEALKFCRVDGTTLVADSPSTDPEAATVRLGSQPDASEVHTSILPHRTDAGITRAAGPTSTLPPPTPTTTGTLTKPKSRKAIVIAVIVTAVFAAVTAVVVMSYLSRRSSAAIDSIAVLPFENKSNDPEAEYLSDGLAESLIYRLSQLPNLKVSPTSSVMRYKGKGGELSSIANELGVRAVLTGRLVQRGDSLTISVELIDVSNSKLIWGEQYERKMSDLLQTQREIAAAITNKLQLKLSGDEKGLTKKYTNNNEAYQLYLKGRFHYAKRTKDDMRRSIEYFQQAINLDPNFALAYVGIAQSYNLMPGNLVLSPKEAFPQAKAAAQRALTIDPSLAEAHGALATTLALYDWNWTEAEREFKQAIELNPNVAEIHYFYGLWHLVPNGRFDEAIREVKQALELEPLSIPVGSNLASVYILARQKEAALEQARKTYNLDPNNSQVASQLGLAYIANERYAEANALGEKSLQLDPMNPRFLAVVGLGYAKTVQPQKAEEIIARLRDLSRKQYVSNYRIAGIRMALGERDKAFVDLENAFAERDALLPRLKVDPLFDTVRDDPRYKDLLKRMNLPE